jgi:hypothetical protein
VKRTRAIEALPMAAFRNEAEPSSRFVAYGGKMRVDG